VAYARIITRPERDVIAMSSDTDAPWRDEELLRQKYVDENLSTRDLRDLWGCSRSTITNWLDRFGVETPSNPENPPWQEKETLEKLYIEQQLTCEEIGERLGCSGRTVDEWRRRYAIKQLHKREEWLDNQYNSKGLYISEISKKCRANRKTVAKWLDEMGVRAEEDRPACYADEKPWHDPERLEELYHGRELSAARVADVMGCSPQTVRHWLIEFGIDRRSCHHRTIDTERSVQRRYPTIEDSHNGEKSTVLIHRFVAYAVGKIGFEELCNPDCIIHHRTNVGWDNRPVNLQPMSRSEHMSLHARADYEPEEI
jgi:transposase